MLKSIARSLVLVALPLGLAAGCATHQTTTAEATYGPAPMLTPTSGEPEQRIYSTDPTAATASGPVDAPPAGANATDWGLAEGIREKLTADPTLAPLGSQLIAEVGQGGAVTLKGVVTTPDEQQRVRDTIASVPGVNSVNDDQLKVGKFNSGGKLDTTQPR